MSTAAQVLASRANGALSNGPLSDATKAISSRNSLKLGIDAQSMIIPGEDPAALERLTAEYHDRYNPVGPVESAILTEAIRAEWLRKRYYRIENDVINMRAAAHTENEAFAVAAAFEQDAKSGNTLQRLFRRQKAADKDWFEALKLLEKIQDIRFRAEFEWEQRALQSAAREAAKAAAQARPPTLGFVLTTDRNPSRNLLPRPLHKPPRRRRRTSHSASDAKSDRILTPRTAQTAPVFSSPLRDRSKCPSRRIACGSFPRADTM